MEQILSLIEKLVTIQSTAENNGVQKEVLEVASDMLKEFPIDHFEKNGIQSIIVNNKKNKQKKFKILLNAHLDVVPGLEQQYRIVNREGKLFARGAYDMKAAAAVFIILFKELAKKIPYSLGLQLVTDEEMGGAYGTKYQLSKGITAEFVIAGEPTNFAIGNESKGILSLEITTKGKNAHAAHLWEGENAVVKLLPTVQKILKAFPIPHNNVWQTTANLAWIHTDNTTSNKVPDKASARFDFRYIPEDKANLQKKIYSLISKNIEYRIFSVEDGQKVSKKDTFIKILEGSARQTLQRPLVFLKNHSASDVRYYSSQGVPAITFGPKGFGLHSDNEWVDVKSLEEYYNILKVFLLSL